MRRRMVPRSVTVRPAQDGCAVAAAVTAASTSSARDLAARLRTSPVAGAIFSNVSPVEAGRSSPSMKFPIVVVCVGAVTVISVNLSESDLHRRARQELAQSSR